jgi:hypothetical protein
MASLQKDKGMNTNAAVGWVLLPQFVQTTTEFRKNGTEFRRQGLTAYKG